MQFKIFINFGLKMFQHPETKICPKGQNLSISPDQNMSQGGDVSITPNQNMSRRRGAKRFNTPILYTT